MKASVSEASKKAQAALCHLEMWHRAACVISYFIRRLRHVVLCLGNHFENLHKKIPELAYGRNVHSLLWRVNVAQCGAERNHFHVGIILEEQSALKAGMDSVAHWLVAKELLMSLNSHLEHLRLQIRSPAGISITVSYLGTCRSEDSLHAVGDIIFTALHRAALRSGDENPVAIEHLH